MKHDIKWFVRGVASRIVRYYGLTRVEFFHIIAIFLRPWLGKSHYWLLHERGVDAQDNAWHFLKYLRREHPEINVRYAIRKSSPDYHNLQEFKDVVLDYNSFWYYMIVFNADVIATTHYHTSLYPHNLVPLVWKTCLGMRAKIIFLQHGVMRHKNKGLAFPVFCGDIFICGAKIEHDMMLSEGMSFPPTVAKYTGLARYDNLWDNEEKNQILIMPTWRIQYTLLSCEEFSSTGLFQYYKALLTNSRLLSKLQETGFEINYYNHFEFQRFNTCFEELESKNVHMIKFGSIRVQELLKQSKVLMTDFSSIYYDFLFMGKPIVFAAQNEEDYNQYGKRYDGDLSDFGYATYKVDEAVDALCKVLDAKCKLENKFLVQQKRVFPLRDSKNCERIFQTIKEIL